MDIPSISRTGPAAAAGKSSGPKRSASGDFKSLLDIDEASEASPARAASAASGIDALLMAQETGDAMEGRRKNKERANQLLDKMEELRLGILAGRMPSTQLRTLAHLAAQERTQMEDPALASILDDIELRVAVELAKLDIQA